MFTVIADFTENRQTVKRFRLWSEVTNYLRYIESSKTLINWTVKSEDFNATR